MKLSKAYLIENQLIPKGSDIEVIEEGVYSPSIFKAIFLAGGSGSGKSYVTKKTTRGQGLKVVNSDDIFEYNLAKENMSFDIGAMDETEYLRAMELRDIAKDLTSRRQDLYLKGRLGLVIDGTGRNFDKIKKQSDMLKSLGYDTAMIFVNTSLDTALARNQKRARKVPIEVATSSWQEVQDNMGHFQRYFGNDEFMIVDNNNASDPELLEVWVDVMKFVNQPVHNPIAKQWIKTELDLKRRN